MVHRIVEGVYRISMAWSHAYLLVDSGEAVLIDTGLQQDRQTLLEGLREVGVEAERIRIVCLTHAHCDHAGNAAYLTASATGNGRNGVRPKNRPRACLAMHHAEAPFLAHPPRFYGPRGWRAVARPHTVIAFAAGEWVYPVQRCATHRLLSEGDLIQAPGGPLRVVETPGHTPGHVSFFREHDGLLFSGDAVINIIPVKRIPGLSLPMRHLTDDWEQAKLSARKLAALRPSILLGGHGRPLVEETADRLAAWAERL